MAYGQSDPARLKGAALDQWYRRTPTQIEAEKLQAAQSERTDYFGR